jgi:LysR family transcriptional regulator for metE and metH
MERFILEQNIQLPLRREMTGNGAVKQAVMANFGLAFLSLHAVALELREGLLVSVDVLGMPLMHRWNVVEATTSPLSDMGQALRRFIIDRGTGGTLLSQGLGAGAPSAPH